MTEIENGSNRYEVGKMVGKTEFYNLYLCMHVERKRECLLQIAAKAEYNSRIQRAAYILKELERQSDFVEKEYAKVKTDPNVLLNYKLGYPEVVDSFLFNEQGGRQVNILAFRFVDKVSDMVPLTNITNKDHLRIDSRTSAWIMGKSLKLMGFAHAQGFSIGLATGANILIDGERHYVVIFDFTQSEIFEEEVLEEIRRKEILEAARAVITALDGEAETGLFPEDIVTEENREYIEYLLKMARGKVSDAKKAHETFYKKVDKTWKREFYPFTAKPLETRIKMSKISETEE